MQVTWWAGIRSIDASGRVRLCRRCSVQRRLTTLWPAGSRIRGGRCPLSKCRCRRIVQGRRRGRLLRAEIYSTWHSRLAELGGGRSPTEVEVDEGISHTGRDAPFGPDLMKMTKSDRSISAAWLSTGYRRHLALGPVGSPPVVQSARCLAHEIDGERRMRPLPTRRDGVCVVGSGIACPGYL